MGDHWEGNQTFGWGRFERRKTGGYIRGGRVENGFRGMYLYNVYIRWEGTYEQFSHAKLWDSNLPLGFS